MTTADTQVTTPPATMRTPHVFEIAVAAMAMAGIGFTYLSALLGGEAGGPLGALLFLFGYFTIWMNTLVAWAYGFGRRSGFVRGGLTVFIAMVGLVYHFLLSHLDPMRDVWNVIGNTLIHYIVPAAVVTDWLVFGPRSGLRWRWAVIWLAVPLLYTVMLVGAGMRSGSYPYPFLDLDTLGVAGLLRETGTLLLAFLTFSLAVIAVRKVLSGRIPASGPA